MPKTTEKLSPAELLVIQMLRSGTPLPTATERAIVPPKQSSKRPDDFKFAPHWKKDIRLCPRCKETRGPIATDFGVRLVRGVERMQSWCKRCRASVNYYNKKRKNTNRQG